MIASLLSFAVAALLAQAGPPGQPAPADTSAARRGDAQLPADGYHPAAEKHAQEELHGKAAEGSHQGTAHEGTAHEGAEHEGGVAEHIFHHVQDEQRWVPIDIYPFGRHLDLSISKHVVSMWVASGLLLLVFALATRKRALVPKGLYNLLETFVLFVRDEIAVKNIGHHSAHLYVGYLCTAFFFILFCNLFGLIPYKLISTPTSSLSVTVVLALFTFGLTQIAGMRAQGVVGYWTHLVPSGVPKWLYPIMLPVELLGLFTKPFALTVRLFANMLAGHIVIYFLIALTVIISVWVAPVSIAFALGIYLLELFVALVQAYIFTMLSALFIGMTQHAH